MIKFNRSLQQKYPSSNKSIYGERKILPFFAISQPALSKSIKRLESDLGAILFYRSRSGIKLTSQGRAFLVKAKSLIQSINDLSFSTEEKLSFQQTIRIGCHGTVAQYSIPKALSFLKTKTLDYKIELIHDLSRNIQADIQKEILMLVSL